MTDSIRALDADDRSWLAAWLAQYLGSTRVVSRGTLHQCMELPGWALWRDGEPVGVLLVQEAPGHERSCEIVMLQAALPSQGVGTPLIEHVLDWAWRRCLRRLWLITTNDNTHALRFYQKRGFQWVDFHPNALIESRRLKPEIPELGNDGIPILHELELEWRPTSNPPPSREIPQGGLRRAMEEATKRGHETGALSPLRSSYEIWREQGIPFQLRVLEGLQKKDAAKAIEVALKQRPAPPFNPFLPYEPDLFVGDLSATHLAVLNKFKILDHHTLLITRAFASQLELLGEADFEASMRCLQEVEGLIFFNGGEAAGASQPHKHLQFLPFPLAPEMPRLPISEVVEEAVAAGAEELEIWPFAHRLKAFPTPQAARRAYLDAMEELQLLPDPSHRPYNLLLTRRWLAVIPRSQEFSEGISINALGFAGGILARRPEQLEGIRQRGVLPLLAQVAYPRP